MNGTYRVLLVAFQAEVDELRDLGIIMAAVSQFEQSHSVV